MSRKIDNSGENYRDPEAGPKESLHSGKILFETSKVKVKASLNDSKTALAIYKSLPIKSKVNTWGDEIYFSIPVTCKPENPTLNVEVGDVAYWPEGRCLCIFFGRTPASDDGNPKPASEVDIIGKVVADTSILKNIKSGEEIIARRLD